MASHDALLQVISQAKSLSIWLDQKINPARVSIREPTDRYYIGIALLLQSLDLADAIIVLLEKKLLGPAWTLARPLYECFVRCIWILECASEKNLKQFQRGKIPKFAELLESIEKGAPNHAIWIRSTQKNMNHFHDFTHAGIEHVLRRINEESVESNFPNNELVYLVQMGIEVRIRIGVEAFSPTLLDDILAIKELHDRVQHFRREPLFHATVKHNI